MKLYVARHGETEWNRLNKVCGRTDSPLTDKGLQQAQLLAERLDSCSIDDNSIAALQGTGDSTSGGGEKAFAGTYG